MRSPNASLLPYLGKIPLPEWQANNTNAGDISGILCKGGKVIMSDEYYQSTIDTMTFIRVGPNDHRPLVLRWHQSRETYRGGEGIIPLKSSHGKRDYVHVKFGFRDISGQFIETGSAQAWYYPVERIIVLWEVIFSPWAFHETEKLTVWRVFERYLWTCFCLAQEMVTTRTDPAYDISEIAQLCIALKFGEPPENLWVKGRPVCFWKRRPEEVSQ